MTTTAELAREEPQGSLGGELDDDSITTLLGVAQNAHAGGHLVDAREILHGLVVAQRSHPEAWRLLGDVERTADNLEDAREAYALALSLADDLDAALSLAEVHQKLGTYEKSQALLTWVTLKAPSERKDLFDRISALSAAQKSGRGDA